MKQKKQPFCVAMSHLEWIHLYPNSMNVYNIQRNTHTHTQSESEREREREREREIKRDKIYMITTYSCNNTQTDR